MKQRGMPPRQPDLFGYRVIKQPGRHLRDLAAYDAIIFLRNKGFKIRRVSGRQHNLDGSLVDTVLLKTIARQMGWDGERELQNRHRKASLFRPGKRSLRPPG